MKQLNVALVGVGFGGAFVDIYKHHPNVARIGIYDIDQTALQECAEFYGIETVYQSFEEILEDNSVDAVHLVTPIPLHGEQTVRVLEAGKHCACTVPMAISLEEIQKITDAVRKSGKNYMMMETALYTYNFFYVKELLERGEIGKIQFLRGDHYQDMAYWPDYWMGLPPMYYGTHAIAPMVALSGSRISRVICFGSGTMEPWLCQQYGNPFPVESALVEFENGIKGEVTRTLFEVARGYREGFHLYGSQKSFEWGYADASQPYVTAMVPRMECETDNRGRTTATKVVEPPNYHHSLPKEIQRFTVGKNYDPLNPQKSLTAGAGGGHLGSHPHLVHEFVMSILEERKPWIDEVLGANITAAGICAHESAMKNGEPVVVPLF